MSDLGHYSLQKALYQQLTGNTDLMAIVSGVYDRPAQGTLFPYITIGEATIADLSCFTINATQQTIGLYIWSREGGRKQAATLLDQLYAMLHQTTIAVDGQVMVSMRFVSSDIALQDDGVTYQGVLRLRVILQAS